MNSHLISDAALEKRIASRVLDVPIHAGLILAMVTLCYKFFAPFLRMTIWSLILAITLYSLHLVGSDSGGIFQSLDAAVAPPAAEISVAPL
jgi:hypothetical protein